MINEEKKKYIKRTTDEIIGYSQLMDENNYDEIVEELIAVLITRIVIQNNTDPISAIIKWRSLIGHLTTKTCDNVDNYYKHSEYFNKRV